MKTKYLSIIIPTYNMEEYLHKCLDSLLVSQNIDCLEVIVVNDGSTDNSSDIAQNYCERFPNIFRVINKPNGNYGSCINRGLQEATGKYIKILDADDCYEKEGLKILLAFLKTTDVDIVFTDYLIVDENDSVKKAVSFQKEFPTCAVFNLSEMLLKNRHFWGAMHAICYKTQILRDMNYRQLEGVSYTDMQWGLMPVTQCKDAYYIPHVVYRYLIGREGQTVSEEQRNKHRSHIMKALLAMAKDTELTTWDKTKFEQFVYNKFIGHLEYLYKDLLTNTKVKDELKEFDRNLSSYKYVYSFADDLIFQGRFHYVTYWRKHDYKCIPSFILKYYTFLEAIYVRFFKVVKRFRNH